MADDVEALKARIAELQEQNAYLRESAAMFGQLAERINHRLLAERLTLPASPLSPPGHDPRSPKLSR